ncbi:MAG: ATP-binding protein [Candidatus Aadella gelida]|nr:ATP-binding protein [Candidatus Aadella gelida]
MKKNERTEKRITQKEDGLKKLKKQLVKTKEEYEKNEENYRSIFESANDAIFIHDMKTGAILDANKKACKMYGYALSEIKKVSVQDISQGSPPYTQKEAAGYIRRAVKEGSQIFEWYGKNKRGKLIWVEVSLKKTVINGKDRVIAIARDITERKQAEEKLKKAQEEIKKWNRELERRIRKRTNELKRSQHQLIQAEKLSSLGQLSAGVAHELNSPLAGLLTLLSTYKKKATVGSDEGNEIDEMILASKHMARIVKDLNMFAKDTKGEMTDISLNDVISSTLSFRAYLFSNREHTIRLIKKIDKDLLCIKGNQGQLQQIIINLITNACDAMPDGGDLTIRTRNSKDRSGVIVEVENTGEGIIKENLDKIFEPFFTTKQQGKGTGLGLTISHGIVKKHGGEIVAKSQKGKGTKFTLCFPAVGKEKLETRR